MALLCPSCQTQNPDDNQFCQGCGRSLAGVQPAAPAQGQEPQSTGYEPQGAAPSQPGQPPSTGYEPQGQTPAGGPPGQPGQDPSTGYAPGGEAPAPGQPGQPGQDPSTGYQPQGQGQWAGYDPAQQQQGQYGQQQQQWTGYDPAQQRAQQLGDDGGRQQGQYDQQGQWAGYDPAAQQQQGQYPQQQQGQYAQTQQGQYAQTQQGQYGDPQQQGQYGQQQWAGYDPSQQQGAQPGGYGQQPPGGGYNSPYYQPTTSPQVSRTSPGVIIAMAAAAVGILVVIVIVIVLVARAVHGGSPTPTTHPSVAPSPSSNPGGSGQVVSTGTVSIKVLSGFQVGNKDDTSVELDADNGAVLVASGQSNQPVTVDQLFQNTQASLQKKYPDVSSCVDDQQLTVAGKQGHARGYKYTMQGSSGGSTVVCHVYWYSVSSDGKTIYEWQQVSDDSDFDAFEAKAKQERATIQWKI